MGEKLFSRDGAWYIMGERTPMLSVRGNGVKKETLTAFYKTLVERLLVLFAPHAPFSRQALKALFSEKGFREAVLRAAFKKETLCGDTLNVCLNVMEAFCEQPQGGWLPFVYDVLSDGLFPSNLPPISEGQKQAMLFYLIALREFAAFERTLRPYDALYDLLFVTEEEREKSRVREEYLAFVRACEDSFYLELMRIGNEIFPFSPLAHASGVHHVAVHMARMANRAGAHADVALVSAAAACHDIGKFGCRGNDAKRIPYLHYYFTDQWLRLNGMPAVAHIAANHSTWDLEFENLPIESLLLIYSDFRVRGEKAPDGREQMRIFPLPEAREAIFSKLYNVDDEKRARYERVYHKLRDFEEYLASLGVSADPFVTALCVPVTLDASLKNDEEVVKALRLTAVGHNIALMHAVSSNASFARLLENARSEKNLDSVRTHLRLFEEYFTYMSRANKLQLLSFLYELLMHHESDVRRHAGQIMGRVLANRAMPYKKELPEHAPESAVAPAVDELLSEAAALFNDYLELLLHPDHKISYKHQLRIKNSLKVVVEWVFRFCPAQSAKVYLDAYLAKFSRFSHDDCFSLADSLTHVPASLFTKEQLCALIRYTRPMLESAEVGMNVCALRALKKLFEERPDDARDELFSVLSGISYEEGSAPAWLFYRLHSTVPQGAPLQALYLENLKNAVHWMVKITNIERLLEQAKKEPALAFHAAMHLSNLLSVSEHLPVRERAGDALMEVAPLLTVDQCNEIVVDLSRGLETGQYEFTRYIPPCLGKLLGYLPEKELDETLDALEKTVRTGNTAAACAALDTIGAALVCALLPDAVGQKTLSARQMRLLGTLFTGLAHYNDQIGRVALNVLCAALFSNGALSLSARRELFPLAAKKLLCLLVERRESELNFFNTAAMLNHLYRFITECDVRFGAFCFTPPSAAAFFPGTFDPFSAGHKRIVEEILALGFEVYLSIDEFSWSKYTQPKLMRRQVALMSVADRFGVYLFPDELPINISNPSDLRRLKELFAPRKLYLVAGTDVIENASAYFEDTGAAASFDHIIFARSASEGSEKPFASAEKLTGEVITLTLPTYYEDVSSSRIRENIDKNLDISMLVDPVAQGYIYENGMYLRAPQYKTALSPAAPWFTRHSAPDAALERSLAALPPFVTDVVRHAAGRKGFLAVTLNGGGRTLGIACGHTLDTRNHREITGDEAVLELLRTRVSGRALEIDCVYAVESASSDAPRFGVEDAPARLLNELLARSLERDDTYAICFIHGDEALCRELSRKGFLSAEGNCGAMYVDMRAPMVMLEDAFLCVKEPLLSAPEVRSAIMEARKNLQTALAALYPGELVLSFNAELLMRALVEKVQRHNGVLDVPLGRRKLGPNMCVPYGNILSDIVVPNTVTKALHVEKTFAADIKSFSITEYPGYSPLLNQVRAIKSFNRPVILTDDLFNKGVRLERVSGLFEQEGVELSMVVTGILSGRGKDSMDARGMEIDSVYFVPNLKYWFTESVMYPFFGGDSVARDVTRGGNHLNSINLILPYKTPDFLRGCDERAVYNLSRTSLENAYNVLRALEKEHQTAFGRSLTLARLASALNKPRLLDRGHYLRYDRSVPASAYIKDDLEQLGRLGGSMFEA